MRRFGVRFFYFFLFAALAARGGIAQTANPEAMKWYEAARASEAGRQFDRAIEEYREVFHRGPRSPQAPEAQFRLALITARTGRLEDALLEFQQVRNLFPESPWAETALQHMSTLYRWQRGQLGPIPAGAPHPLPFLAKVLETRLPESFEEPQSAFFNARHELVVFDRHRKRVMHLGSAGEILENTPFAAPQALARPGLGFEGESYLAEGETLRVLEKPESIHLSNPQKRGEGTLKNITAMGLSASRELWITSSDLTGVLRYSLERGVAEVLNIALTPKNIRSIEFDAFGNVYFFDSRQSRILVTNSQGETRTVISPDAASYGISTLADVYIDHFNQLHLLDAEERVLAVWAIREETNSSLKFIPVNRVAYGSLNASPEFRSIRTFAVTEQGEYILIPRKSARLLKIY